MASNFPGDVTDKQFLDDTFNPEAKDLGTPLLLVVGYAELSFLLPIIQETDHANMLEFVYVEPLVCTTSKLVEGGQHCHRWELD